MTNSVLVVAPHLDDEVLGCGGTIARHVAEGDEVQVAIVSMGDLALYPIEEEEAQRLELKAAHEVLGVAGVHFLDFPAPRLDTVPGYHLADAIGHVVRSVKPTIVYLPYRGDIHVDHRAVYLATLVATRPINACPVRQLLCYETLSETEWASPFGDEAFIPNVFVYISDFLPRKLQAFSCYESQLKQFPHPRSLEGIESLARFRGATVSVPAAEAFMLIRQIL